MHAPSNIGTSTWIQLSLGRGTKLMVLSTHWSIPSNYFLINKTVIMFIFYIYIWARHCKFVFSCLMNMLSLHPGIGLLLYKQRGIFVVCHFEFPVTLREEKNEVSNFWQQAGIAICWVKLTADWSKYQILFFFLCALFHCSFCNYKHVRLHQDSLRWCQGIDYTSSVLI